MADAPEGRFSPGSLSENNAVLQLAASLANGSPALLADRINFDPETDFERPGSPVLDESMLTDTEKDRIPEARFVVDSIMAAIHHRAVAANLERQRRGMDRH